MAEAKNIAASMTLTLEAFIARYADPRWPGETSILVRQHNGACIFLEQTSSKETRCLINHLKPSSCLEFKAGLSQKECREGLAKYWQLTVGSSGEPDGDGKNCSISTLFWHLWNSCRVVEEKRNPPQRTNSKS